MGSGWAEGVRMKTKPGEKKGLGGGRVEQEGRNEALEAGVGWGGRKPLGSSHV